MSKNKNVNLNVIDGFLRNDKLFLILTVALSSVVDIILSIYAIYSGIALLITQTIITLVADLLLLLAIIKTNFRFAYGRIVPILYVVISVGLTVFSSINFANALLDNTALISFIVTKAICVIAVILATFNASVLGKVFKLVTFVFLVLTFGVSVYYSAYVLNSGYFGQGSFGYKNVSYKYDSVTDSYIALETVGSNGDKVVIPNEFNGKPITKLNARLFNDESVGEIYLNCDNNVEIEKVYVISNDINSNLKIYADKNVVDVFKNKFKENVKESGEANAYYLSLMNKVIPCNLSENERFISFDYTVESLAYADYEIIKTWIGDKNESFSLMEHAGDIEYVSAFNDKNESYYKDCYDSGKLALQSLLFNEREINGATVSGDMPHVEVAFENVYAIKIADDNDLLYEPSLSFKQLDDSGLRYVVKSDKNALINSIDNRDGFSLSWKQINGITESPFVNLDSILKNETYLTIAPVWTLNNPIINSAKTSGDGNYVYGDNFNLVTEATAPISDYLLSYNWSYQSVDGETITDSVGVDSTVAFNNVLPSQSGKYKVTVTAYSDTQTSLTSTATQTVDVTINKKTLGFNWQLPEDKIYSGSVKTVTASYDTNDVINLDVIEFDLVADKDEIKNAGEYKFNLSLKGDANTKYVIDSNDVANSLTIDKRQIGLVWETSEFTYDGSYQYVKATAVNNAVSGDEESLINGLVYTGYGRNAGNYNLTAVLVHSNYKIGENATTNYTINPKEVTASFTNLEFTYNGKEYCPEAVISGIVNYETQNDLKLTYTGKALNAGSYTATVSVGNSNYVLTGENSTPYVIKQKELKVVWKNVNKIYNGKIQYPEASALGLIAGEVQSVLDLKYSGGGANAGRYTATVEIGRENSNYKLTTETTTTNYVIDAKELNVSWGNEKLTYNGQVQRPSYSVTGLVNGENVSSLGVEVTEGNVNVGSYKAIISITNVNYVIKTEQREKSYNIDKKQLSVTWTNRNLVYNGEEQLPTYTLTGLVNGESESTVNFNVTGGKTDATEIGKSYTATASINSDNYNLSSGGNTTFTIIAKEVTLIWENFEFTYDETPKTPIVTGYNGLITGDDLQLECSPSKTTVGTYTATATTGNKNYKITNPSIEFVIKHKEVTVNFDAKKEFDYTGNKIELGVTLSETGLSFTCEYYEGETKLNGAPTEVGEYVVKVSISNTNYKLTGVTEASFRIIEVVKEEE